MSIRRRLKCAALGRNRRRQLSSRRRLQRWKPNRSPGLARRRRVASSYSAAFWHNKIRAMTAWRPHHNAASAKLLAGLSKPLSRQHHSAASKASHHHLREAPHRISSKHGISGELAAGLSIGRIIIIFVKRSAGVVNQSEAGLRSNGDPALKQGDKTIIAAGALIW